MVIFAPVCPRASELQFGIVALAEGGVALARQQMADVAEPHLPAIHFR